MFRPKLKDYLDCVQHDTSLEMGPGSTDIIKNAKGTWTTSLRIPDNPEVKSRTGFTFNARHDALQYSIAILAELARNVAAIGEAMPRREPTGN